MNWNRRNSEGDNPGGGLRPMYRSLDAALIDYHELTTKWQALGDANQAAYREPSTLSIPQAVEQLQREHKLMESMFIDATKFIGRLLGTGDPYSKSPDASAKDSQP